MEFEKFYNKALRFLSFRPRSEKEVRSKLSAKASRGRGKPPSEQTIELIIRKLKEQKFLDDKEFANWWIEQRTIVKPTGLRLIKIELRQKGINQDLIEDVITGSIVQSNELEQAKRLVSKRVKKYGDLPKDKIFQNL